MSGRDDETQPESKHRRLRNRLFTDGIGRTPDRRKSVLPEIVPRLLRAPIDRAALHLTTAGMVTLLTAHSLRTGQRMSHENGLVGRGQVRIVDDLDLPEHAFFKPGRTFGCRVRHSSVSFMDDATLVVRSASIKFADSDYKAPLDIEMNTGEISLFSTAWQFAQFMASTIRGRGNHFAQYFERNPHGALASHVGVRRNPTSFAELYYASETMFRFESLDGRVYACRYRLRPPESVEETGLPDDTDLERVWRQRPLDGETRGPNYLKKEYRRRVLAGPVPYRLQIQLLPIEPNMDEELFNASATWDETQSRWRDLADVTVNQSLRRSEGNLVRYSIAQQPPGLGLFKAHSPFDYNSLNHLRAYAIWAKQARILSYALYGMPEAIDDDRSQQDPKTQAPEG